MKKLLFVAILGTLVACGESTTTTPATDSPVVAVDTTTPAPVVVDTTVHIDTTAVDTTKKP